MKKKRKKKSPIFRPKMIAVVQGADLVLETLRASVRVLQVHTGYLEALRQVTTEIRDMMRRPREAFTISIIGWAEEWRPRGPIPADPLELVMMLGASGTVAHGETVTATCRPQVPMKRLSFLVSGDEAIRVVDVKIGTFSKLANSGGGVRSGLLDRVDVGHELAFVVRHGEP